MPSISRFSPEQIGAAKAYGSLTPPADLGVLREKGELRFTRLSESVEGISQKMLTQTLRQMERDGLVTRTVHPVVPPNEYKLTPLGMSLGAAFCGVWVWAAENLPRVEQARREFDR
jgi:DNA-binding HxlR family transcriptional regulator